MLKHLDHIEDVIVVLLGENERVSHQQLHAVHIIVLNEVVESVGGMDFVVVWVV